MGGGTNSGDGPMTDERLAEIEALARRTGSANCWTGSTSLWTIPMIELVKEVKRLKRCPDCGGSGRKFADRNRIYNCASCGGSGQQRQEFFYDN